MGIQSLYDAPITYSLLRISKNNDQEEDKPKRLPLPPALNPYRPRSARSPGGATAMQGGFCSGVGNVGLLIRRHREVLKS